MTDTAIPALCNIAAPPYALRLPKIVIEAKAARVPGPSIASSSNVKEVKVHILRNFPLMPLDGFPVDRTSYDMNLFGHRSERGAPFPANSMFRTLLRVTSKGTH